MIKNSKKGQVLQGKNNAYKLTTRVLSDEAKRKKRGKLKV